MQAENSFQRISIFWKVKVLPTFTGERLLREKQLMKAQLRSGLVELMVILDKKENRNDRLHNGSSAADVNEDKAKIVMLLLKLTEESQLQKSVSLFNQLQLKKSTSVYFCK